MNDIEIRLRNWFDAPEEKNDTTELATIIRDLKDTLNPVWHPLGFIHVKLLAPSPTESFRLHLWPAELKHKEEQADKIHDHLFNVSSKVVAGSVKNVKYKFKPDKDGDHRILRVHYGQAKSELYESGLTGFLHKIESRTYEAPAAYYVPRFELHETVPSCLANSLTLVRTDSAAAYEPQAVFKKSSPIPRARVPIAYDKAEWLKLLSKMIPI